MPEKVTVRGDNLTLDALLTRRHGLAGSALMKKALVLNPGLPRILPLGAVVTLPDLPPPAAGQTVQVVTLFGRK